MRRLDVLLVVALLVGLLGAACGGPGAATPGYTPIPADSGSPAPTVSGVAPASSVPAPAPETSSSLSALPAPTPGADGGPAPVPTEMKAPSASALQAELTALGLDPKALPPIEKLAPRELRGVMKLMARSLGVKCADCHVYGDFAAPTPRKKVAARMWNAFVTQLTTPDGSPLFCDSCHGGRIKLLDRSDKKALGKWMQASFVDGVKRKDAQPQACETCHVGWDMTFLTAWRR